MAKGYEEKVLSREPVRSRVVVKKLGEKRNPPIEGAGILDFEEGNKESVEPGRYALVSDLTLSGWDEDSEVREEAKNKIVEELRKFNEYRGRAIALNPEYLFLPEIDRGPWLALKIEIVKE